MTPLTLEGLQLPQLSLVQFKYLKMFGIKMFVQD